MDVDLECTVRDSGGVVSAVCDYYEDNLSITGFQMMMHLNTITEYQKLLINSTIRHRHPGPISIQVEESGIYNVVIFPIMGERGIVNATIAYSREISVVGMFYYNYYYCCCFC